MDKPQVSGLHAVEATRVAPCLATCAFRVTSCALSVTGAAPQRVAGPPTAPAPPWMLFRMRSRLAWPRSRATCWRRLATAGSQGARRRGTGVGSLRKAERNLACACRAVPAVASDRRRSQPLSAKPDVSASASPRLPTRCRELLFTGTHGCPLCLPTCITEVSPVCQRPSQLHLSLPQPLPQPRRLCRCLCCCQALRLQLLLLGRQLLPALRGRTLPRLSL